MRVSGSGPCRKFRSPLRALSLYFKKLSAVLISLYIALEKRIRTNDTLKEGICPNLAEELPLGR